jgi:hypothetical protein
MPIVRETHRDIINYLLKSNLTITERSRGLRKALVELADYSESTVNTLWTEKKQAILE